MHAAKIASDDCIIYTHSPNTWQQPLDTDAFYPARSAAIDVRLQDIAIGEAGELMHDAANTMPHARYAMQRCSFLSFGAFTLM